MLWAQSATKGYIRANNKHFFLKLTRELVFFNKIATGSTPGYMSRGWIYVFAVTSCNVRRHLVKIWNRMRPRVAGQNQQTGELICTEKTSHEHNNRDLKSSWQLACEHNTRYVNSNGGTCSNQTHPEPLVEIMCFVFTRKQGEGYRRQLRSLLLRSCEVFWVLILKKKKSETKMSASVLKQDPNTLKNYN